MRNKIAFLLLIYGLLLLPARAEDQQLKLSSVRGFNYAKQQYNPTLEISVTITSEVDSEDKNSDTINRYVLMVLPFENFSSDPAITKVVMKSVEEVLKDLKGETLLDHRAVRNFMIKYRVRHTSIPTSSVRYAIYNELGIQRVMVGSIVEYSDKGFPSVGLMARLIETRTGRIIWAGFYSVYGGDGFKIFGLGSIKKTEKLVYKAVKGLFSDYNPASINIPPSGDIKKVAIVPFKNDTNHYGIGLIASQLYLYELYKSDSFLPYDIGETREIMLKKGIMPTGELTNKTIEIIGRDLDIDYILIGSVVKYSREYPKRVTLFSRLIDVKSKNLVWAGFKSMTNEDSIIVFDIGLMHTLDRVMHKIVEKQTREMEKKI